MISSPCRYLFPIVHAEIQRDLPRPSSVKLKNLHPSNVLPLAFSDPVVHTLLRDKGVGFRVWELR